MPQWDNFINTELATLSELLPPLSKQEALVEANRCLFCYDAPCTHACPTHIDIPRFIKKIASGNNLGSARTILEANLLGATCSRVCPVQELCEGACVLGSEHKPIMIGRLQRYAMDFVYGQGIEIFEREPATGHNIVVVGAGPAGLSCAGELAKRGHSVTVFEKRELPGGLSTYGIIGLREPVSVALAEVEMIQQLGVEFKTGFVVGSETGVSDLLKRFDVVFLSAGLGHTPVLNIPGEEHIVDGLSYIEQSKVDPASLKVGNKVLVIGAGNTGIDCATIALRLGAEHVTIVYRRSEAEVSAYRHEMEFIRKEGAAFRFLSQPTRVLTAGERVIGLECVRTELGSLDRNGRPTPLEVPGSEFILQADQIVKAIGQGKPTIPGLTSRSGYIEVDANYQTAIPNVFAGGDCIRRSGTCSTVMAVQDGKLAALAIHKKLAASVLSGAF